MVRGWIGNGGSFADVARVVFPCPGMGRRREAHIRGSEREPVDQADDIRGAKKSTSMSEAQEQTGMP
jgi:hypothetical protein